jgi:hypothetical protein
MHHITCHKYRPRNPRPHPLQVGEMLRLQRLAPSPADFPAIPISFYRNCMRMPMCAVQPPANHWPHPTPAGTTVDSQLF